MTAEVITSSGEQNQAKSTLKVVKGLVMLLLLVWIVSDVSGRFFSNTQDSRNNLSLQQLQPIPKVQLSVGQFGEISALYEQFGSQDDSGENQQASFEGLSPEQQALQKGNLTKVFAGDKILELKAVIAQKNKLTTAISSYVLLNVTDIKTSKSDVIQIMNKQTIHGYSLDIIDNTHVKLVSEAVSPAQSDPEVNLVLVMYKKNDNVLSGKNQ
jgi:hypothetical protein